MKVDFYNFHYVPEEVKNNWRLAFESCIQEGVFIGGSAVSDFENQFSKILGCVYSIGVSNGYDGLELALRALDIGAGKKVALPAHTFIATWNAVIAVGATPVGVDIGDDGQMDTVALTRVVEQQEIACVIPVHMHGHVADLKTIKRVCDAKNISIIEDASQAHLAHRDALKAGVTGDIGVFSLYPTKNLGALGDSGVIVTNQEKLERKIRSMSNYGSKKDSKYEHSQLGFNRRLDSLQARILSENLKFLEEWNRKRQEKVDIYLETMQEMSIKFLPGREGSVWHHFCIFSDKRDALQDYLKRNGVGTEVHYPNLAAYEVEEFMGTKRNYYPVAEQFANSVLSLPLSPFHDNEMIRYVCGVMRTAHIEEQLC